MRRVLTGDPPRPRAGPPAGHGTQPTRHRAPPRSRARSATDTASAGSHQQPPPLRAGTAGVLDGPAPLTPGPHGAGSTSRSDSAQSPPQSCLRQRATVARLTPTFTATSATERPAAHSATARRFRSDQRRAKYAAAAMSCFVMFSGHSRPRRGPPGTGRRCRQSAVCTLERREHGHA